MVFDKNEVDTIFQTATVSDRFVDQCIRNFGFSFLVQTLRGHLAFFKHKIGQVNLQNFLWIKTLNVFFVLLNIITDFSPSITN